MGPKNDGVPEHDIVVAKTQKIISKHSKLDTVGTLGLLIHQLGDLAVIV